MKHELYDGPVMLGDLENIAETGWVMQGSAQEEIQEAALSKSNSKASNGRLYALIGVLYLSLGLYGFTIKDQIVDNWKMIMSEYVEFYK